MLTEVVYLLKRIREVTWITGRRPCVCKRLTEVKCSYKSSVCLL